MNSVISAFKTKKNSSNSASANDKSTNNVGTLNTTSSVSAKKKAINAQDNGYQYLRHIREIESATKMLSPVVVVDDFRPPCVDVVDYAPAAVRLAAALDTALPADYNMNGAKCAILNGGAVASGGCEMMVRVGNMNTTNLVANVDNGNCNEAPASKTVTNGQTQSPPTPSSPVAQLLDADDDESEHSTAACTSSSSEQSNSTVVHSPKGLRVARTMGATVTPTAQPSPAKSLRSNSSTSSSSSSSSSTSTSTCASTNSGASTSASSSIAAICNSGPSSCSSSTSCDATTLANSSPHNSTLTLSSTGSGASVTSVASASSSPTEQLISSNAADADYVPAFLKSAPVTLPIIMPNGNSSLGSMPPHYHGYGGNGGGGSGIGVCGGTPVNSASTTPKHVRYPKPRLSLSRFINHSMPSVHGRPNLSVAGGAAAIGAGAGGAAGTNPPKRISTHQRNLSLDFR